MLMGMTVGKREVGWIIRHRMTTGSDTYPGIGYREVGLGDFGHGDVLDRVPLSLRTGGIQRILQFHIRIQRIVFRRSLLLRHTII